MSKLNGEGKRHVGMV